MAGDFGETFTLQADVSDFTGDLIGSIQVIEQFNKAIANNAAAITAQKNLTASVRKLAEYEEILGAEINAVNAASKIHVTTAAQNATAMNLLGGAIKKTVAQERELRDASIISEKALKNQRGELGTKATAADALRNRIKLLATSEGGFFKILAGGLTLQQRANALTNAAANGFANLLTRVAQYAIAGGAVYTVINLTAGAFHRLTEAEDGTAKALTVLTESTEQAKVAHDEVRNLILNTSAQFGISVKETSDAFYQLGSAGLSLQESIAGLSAVVNLAVGNNDDLGATAKTVAGIFQLYGDSVAIGGTLTDKFNAIADTMAITLRESQLELQDLREGFKFIGGAAKTAGIPLDAVAASMSILSNNMIRASIGARSLRSTLSSLFEKAERVQDAFGATFVPGNFESMLQVLQNINRGLSDQATQAQTITKIYQIFGVEAANTVQVLALNVDELRANTKAFGEDAKGTADTMRSIRLDNLSGQIKIFKESVGALAVEVLSFSGSVLGLFLSGLTSTINEIRKFDSTLLTTIVSISVLSPALLGLYSLLVKLQVVGFLSGLLNVTGDAFLAVAKFGAPAAAAMQSFAVSVGLANTALTGFQFAALGLTATFGGLVIAGLVANSAIHAWDNSLRESIDDLRNSDANVKGMTKHLDDNGKSLASNAVAIKAYVTAIDQGRNATTALERAGEQVVGQQKNSAAAVERGAEAYKKFAHTVLESSEAAVKALHDQIQAEKESAFFSGKGASLIDAGKKLQSFGDEIRRLTTDLEAAKNKQNEFNASAKQKFFDTDENAGPKVKELIGQIRSLELESLNAKNVISESIRADSEELLNIFGSADKAIEALKVKFKTVPKFVEEALNEAEENRKKHTLELINIEELLSGVEQFKEINQAIRDIAAETAQATRDADAVRIKSTADRAIAEAQANQDAFAEAEARKTQLKELTRLEVEGVNERIAAIKEASAEELRALEARRQIAIDQAANEAPIEQRKIVEQFAKEKTKIEVKAVQDQVAAAREGTVKINALKQTEIDKANEAYIKQKQFDNDLKQAQLQTAQVVRDAKLDQLDGEEKLLAVQREIKRSLADASSAAGRQGGLEEAKASIADAKNLLSQIPKEAIKNGEEIAVSEEDLADLRVSLAKKIALANEDVIRSQQTALGGFGDQVVANAQIVDQSLQALATSSATSLSAIEGQLGKLLDPTTKIGERMNAAFGTDALDNAQSRLDGIAKKLSEMAGLSFTNLIALLGAMNNNQGFGGTWNGDTQERFRWGGPIGSRFGGGDMHNIKAEGGEWMVRKEAAAYYGSSFMNNINNMAFPHPSMTGSPAFNIIVTPEALRGSANQSRDSMRKFARNFGEYISEEMSRTSRGKN